MIYIPSPDVQQTQPQQQWWLERWSSQIATALALLILLCGLLSTFKPLTSYCIWPGILLLLSSLVILIIEAPSFVTFLSFAREVAKFFTGKSDWIKVAIYTALALIPFIVSVSMDCYFFAFNLGVITSIQVIVLFGVIALRKNASRGFISSQN